MSYGEVQTGFRDKGTELHGTGPNQQDDATAPVHSELERRALDGTMGTAEVERDYSGDFLVRVTSVRRRLLDDDNLCEKYLVDALRYSGLLPGDSPRTTRIETGQRQAKEGEDEHTLVEIFTRSDPEQPSLFGH